MTKRMMIGTTAALAMLSGQAMAAPVANPAASLSVGKSVRAAAPSKKASKFGGSGAIVVGVLAAGALIGGIIAISDDNNSDSN